MLMTEEFDDAIVLGNLNFIHVVEVGVDEIGVDIIEVDEPIRNCGMTESIIIIIILYFLKNRAHRDDG